jgi:hypothetical protein
MMSGESRALAHYKALREHERALNDATAEFERAALQPLLLLNGGAAVAFVTLLGAIWEKASQRINLTWAIAAVGIWVVGLLLAAIATIKGYLSQREFEIRARIEREIVEEILHMGAHPEATRNEMESRRKRAKSHQNWAFGCSLASLMFFAFGVLASFWAIVHPHLFNCSVVFSP